jgi:phage tail-like protein
MKIPGRMKWEDITLKRGITGNMDVWKWRKQVEQGDVEGARKSGSIIMYNQMLTPVARWDFVRAWPSKVTGPQPKSDSNEVAIEEMTIVHEGIERVDA